MNESLSPETLAAQAMGEIDPASGALVPPIHPSTTYEHHPDGMRFSGKDGLGDQVRGYETHHGRQGKLSAQDFLPLPL